MSSKKKLAIAVAGVLVIGAGIAWFGGNQLAKGKAEEELKAFLAENNLQDYVTWESLDASVGGTATLANVKVVNQQNPARFITFQQVFLNKFDNSENNKEIDISFVGLADESGNSPVGQLSMQKLAELGYDRLPHINGAVKVQLDLVTDRSGYQFRIDQPGVANFGINIDANKINALLQHINANKAALANNGMALLQPLSAVSINSLSITVEDKGLVQHIIAKEKGGAPGAKTSVEQDKAYEAKMQQQKQTCVQQGVVLFGETKAEASCDAIYKYVTSQKNGLSIAMNPTPALQIMTLLQLTSGQGLANLPQVLQSMNIEVKN